MQNSLRDILEYAINSWISTVKKYISSTENIQMKITRKQKSAVLQDTVQTGLGGVL